MTTRPTFPTFGLVTPLVTSQPAIGTTPLDTHAETVHLYLP